MKTFDDEEYIWDIYRKIPSRLVKCYGNPFRCLKVLYLTRWPIFAKSWKNSSSKTDLPPDFHNDKHKIMMEFMRVDDSSVECKNNSFEKQNKILREYFGNDYRKKNETIQCFIVPDTRDNNNFNYQGYINNFKRVVEKHSKKIEQYKKNYPQCKSVVFFICDESNNYVEVSEKEDLSKEELINSKFKIHYIYYDKKIIDILKKSNADFIIWFGLYKSIYVNGKTVKQPSAMIFDMKNFKFNGIDYNEKMMYKVTKEQY